MKNIVSFLKWSLILLVILGLSFSVYALVKIKEPYKTGAAQISFTVPAQATTKQIAQNLQAQNLINRAQYFKLYAFFTHQGGKLQAGEYSLSASMPIREIADILSNGKIVSNAVKLTVIEGFDNSDVASALESLGVMKAQTFLKTAGWKNSPAQREAFAKFSFLKNIPASSSLEGFLFPDTYFIAKDSRPVEAAGKMLVNFDRKVTAGARALMQKNGKDFYETIILASIIEREVGRNAQKGQKLSLQDLSKLQEERRLVASVFYNRLKARMALESDATIGYITGSKSNRATLDDLKIDSPYNTYKYRGLPPTPIANPSLDAILAASDPVQTDYLYFVTDSAGVAHFAKTLQEHAANRAKYLE